MLLKLASLALMFVWQQENSIRGARAPTSTTADDLKVVRLSEIPTPYKIIPSTRAHFERMAKRQKQLLVPLAATDTLARTTAWTTLDVGEGPSRVKFQKLRLKLANGKIKELTNKSALFETEQEGLKYAGKIPVLNKYVVWGQYWERASCLLIDRTTGRVDTLWNTPLASPGARKWAAFGQGLPVEGAPNGVQVFAVVGNRLKQLFLIDQEQWVPYDLVWMNDNEFILKTLPAAKAVNLVRLPRTNVGFSYLKVSMRGQLR